MKTFLRLFLALALVLPSFAAGNAGLSVNPATSQLNGPTPAAGVNNGFKVPSGYVVEFQPGSELRLDAGFLLTGLAFGTMSQQNATSVAITGGTITGIGTPVFASDVANKTYVDSHAAGITPRTAVAVASTANLTLSGEQTIDGVLTSASRILVKNQTTTANNGIYVTAAGAWSRASDSDTAGELLAGYYYFVTGGTTQGSSSWTVQTAPTVLGTDPVVFAQFSASASYNAGTGLTLAGNTFNLNAALSGLTLTSSTYNGNTLTAGSYTLTGAAGKTLAWLKTITFTGTDGTQITFPSTNAVMARTDAAQTFTGLQTLTNGFSIPQTAGTTGTTNTPAVGTELSFATFVNATTTTITLPSAVDGNSFMLYFQGCNGTASVTFSGASVFREGDPDTAIAGGLYVPGPAGNHSALVKRVNGRWMLSDDSFQSTYAADTGAANAYVVTLVPAITAYSTGSPLLTFIAANANTAASTLNINALGAKALKKAAGGITTDLSAGDILAGQVVVVAYDGTNFQVISALGNASSGIGAANTKKVTQANAFTIGEVLYNNNGTWTASSNAAAGTAIVDGVVTTTGNPFTVTLNGYENSITGLAANTQYFLGTGGALTATQPSSPTTSFVVPVLHTGVAGDGVVQIGAPASLGKIASGDLASSLALVTPDIGVATGATLTLGTGGTSSTAVPLIINGGSASSGGSYVYFQRNSVGKSAIGQESVIFGNTSDALALYSINDSIRFFVNSGTSVLTLSPSVITAKNPLAFDTNAHLRTAKANLNLLVNVKDYGATGDGSTDDTTNLNTALAAVASGGTVFLPTGTYNHTGLTFPASKTNVTIKGDGAQLYQLTNANNTLVIPDTCSYITIDGLWFNGGGSARANGIHLRINADYTTVKNCRIERSSDWGIQVDASGAAVKGFVCEHNLFKDTCGDGVHVMNVDGFRISNNTFWQCGDDAIAALAQSATIQPLNGIISDNLIVGRSTALAGATTHGFRGIVVMIGKNIQVSHNKIFNTYSSGIDIDDEYSSALYNSEITVEGNTLYGCNQQTGALGSLQMQFCKRSSVTGNHIINPFSGSGMTVVDCSSITVGNNEFVQSLNQFCRGIVTNTSTPYSGRTITACNDVIIAHNTFDLTQASNNEAVYLAFVTGIRCNNLIVACNESRSTALAYITTDYIITGKFVNNVTIGGTTAPTTGANSTGITSTNNL